MVNRLRGKTVRPGKSKSSFVYKKRDPDKLKSRAEQTGGRFDSPWKNGVEIFRAKVGDNLIRILPPTWDEPEHYAYDVWVHSYVGADNSTYVCLNKMKGKHCPICQAAQEAKTAGEEDEAKALQAKKLSVAWIINRDEDEETPMLYAMSWTMDRDIASLLYNKRTGKAIMIDDPVDGYDLTIKRTGQGLKTRYHGMAIERDPTPVNDDPKIQDAVLEYIAENPIPDMLHYHDSKHLEKVLLGTNAEKDDIDEDEDDVKVKRTKRRNVEEDDEEDEEDRPKGKNKRQARDEEEDDEEEEEAPKKRSKQKARDEEEEEDEEEETTTKKRAKRPRDEEEDEEEEDRLSNTRRSKGRVLTVKKKDDDDEDEEDDEDDAPKSRRGKTRDDDDEDEEEDDEDDTPPKRRRR